MANLHLRDLQKNVETNYGPWTVDWGDEDAPRTIKFRHLLTGDKEGREEFFLLGMYVAAAAKGDVSDAQVAEYLGVDLDDDDVDVYRLFTGKVQKVFRLLADDPEEFDAFAAAAGDEFVLWQALLDAYWEHYNLGDEAGE